MNTWARLTPKKEEKISEDPMEKLWLTVLMCSLVLKAKLNIRKSNNLNMLNAHLLRKTSKLKKRMKSSKNRRSKWEVLKNNSSLQTPKHTLMQIWRKINQKSNFCILLAMIMLLNRAASLLVKLLLLFYTKSKEMGKNRWSQWRNKTNNKRKSLLSWSKWNTIQNRHLPYHFLR